MSCPWLSWRLQPLTRQSSAGAVLPQGHAHSTRHLQLTAVCDVAVFGHQALEDRSMAMGHTLPMPARSVGLCIEQYEEAALPKTSLLPASLAGHHAVCDYSPS